MACEVCLKQVPMKCELCHKGTAVAKCSVADSHEHMHICKKCQDYYESYNRRGALFVVLFFALNGWLHNLYEPTMVLAATLVVSYVVRRYVPNGYRILAWVAWLATLAALALSDRIIPTSLAVSTLVTPVFWIARFP